MSRRQKSPASHSSIHGPGSGENSYTSNDIAWQSPSIRTPRGEKYPPRIWQKNKFKGRRNNQKVIVLQIALQKESHVFCAPPRLCYIIVHWMVSLSIPSSVRTPCRRSSFRQCRYSRLLLRTKVTLRKLQNEILSAFSVACYCHFGGSWVMMVVVLDDGPLLTAGMRLLLFAVL